MTEIKYDVKSGIISYKDKIVFLTKRENIIMEMLFEGYPEIVTREEMCEKIFGEELDSYYKGSISTHISRLRKKLKVFEEKIEIKTRHGYGNVLILKD